MTNAKENCPAVASEAIPNDLCYVDTINSTTSSNGNASLGSNASETFIIRKAAKEFFQACQPKITDPAVLESQLVSAINANIDLANLDREKNNKIRLITKLPHDIVAMGLAYLYEWAVVLPPRSSKTGALAVYQASGEDEGVYVADLDVLHSYVRTLLPAAGIHDVKNILSILRTSVPRVAETYDKDLVPVRNGIFNYKTKELRPFDPSYVFTTKVRTALNFDAENPVIQNGDGSTWDVESWVSELSQGDSEWLDACWKMIGASVRNQVRWDKAVYLYDERGESGKGTLVELLRGLHGDESCSSLSVADFGHSHKFRLIELLGKTLNAADENAVGEFADDLANFKAIITHDIVVVEAKGEQPFPIRLTPFIVQCINSLPKARDVSQSSRRRQWFLPFVKSYTGKANRAIKSDYVRRPEVLEYVLKKVLIDIPSYYELPEVEAGIAVAEEARLSNDAVYLFWKEHKNDFVWDLLPSRFLYDMYKAWFARDYPNGYAINARDFSVRLKEIVRDSNEWVYCDNPVRSSGLMSKPEHLIAEYDLKNWMNPVYRTMSHNRDLDKQCMPALALRYRGLRRKGVPPATIEVVDGKPIEDEGTG